MIRTPPSSSAQSFRTRMFLQAAAVFQVAQRPTGVQDSISMRMPSCFSFVSTSTTESLSIQA